jgi:hypothetical protein
MSLINTDTSSGVMIATGHNASAKSIVIKQQNEQEDYRSIDKIVVLYVADQEFPYMVESSEGSFSSFELKEGDDVYILTDKTFSYILPSSTLSATLQQNNNCFVHGNDPRILNTNNKNIEELKLVDINVDYELAIYEYKESVIINGLHVDTDSGSDRVWTIYGSNDSVEFTQIYQISTSETEFTSDKFNNDVAYKFYKIQVHTVDDDYIQAVNLLGYPKKFDISDITSLTPLKVIILPTLKANSKECVCNQCVMDDKQVYLQFEQNTFDASRTIVLDVTLPKIKDSIKEIVFQDKAVQLINPLAMTSNSEPANSVSDSSNSDNAYKIFDEVSTDNILGTTDDSNALDISVIYEFDEATIVYKIHIIHGIAANAMADFTLSGSYDNSTYDTLLTFSQEVSEDYLLQEKRIDCDTQGAYKYYKLNVTKGNTASADVTLNQLKLFIEK